VQIVKYDRTDEFQICFGNAVDLLVLLAQPTEINRLAFVHEIPNLTDSPKIMIQQNGLFFLESEVLGFNDLGRTIEQQSL
jgi:hypothetical protein